MMEWTEWIGEVVAAIMAVYLGLQKIRKSKQEETSDTYEFSVKHITEYNKLVDLFEAHLNEILVVKQDLAKVTMDLDDAQEQNARLASKVSELEVQAVEMREYIAKLEQ